MSTDLSTQRLISNTLGGLPPDVRARITGWICCAEQGWHLFPVRPGDKRPAITDWQHRASTDPARLIAFYSQRPRFNAGIAAGPSGLVVIDCDMPKPGTVAGSGRLVTGLDTLAELAAVAGAEIPDTFTVSTPSGGQHLYFRAPAGPPIGNSARTLGVLLDSRGVGGYVLAPGCWLAPRRPRGTRAGRSGGSYELLDDTPPTELPTWLHRALSADRSTASSGAAEPLSAALRSPGRYLGAVLREELARVHTAGSGHHNAAVFTAARALGQLAAGGALHMAEAEVMLTRAATPIAAGPCDCTARDLVTTIRSGLAYGARRPRRLPTVEQAASDKCGA
jgi:hypothetical protein